MVIGAVTLAELSADPHHTDDVAAERARRTSVLQHTEATFDPLPFDAEAARAFGLVSAGRKPPRRLAALMIASVVHDQPRRFRRSPRSDRGRAGVPTARTLMSTKC